MNALIEHGDGNYPRVDVCNQHNDCEAQRLARKCDYFAECNHQVGEIGSSMGALCCQDQGTFS